MEELDEIKVGEPKLAPPTNTDKFIDKLNRLSTGQEVTGKVTNAVDDKYYSTDLGASKYDKGLIVNQHLDTEDFTQSLQEFRARKQPVSDQIANALVNVVGDITLGTLGQIGSALDFEDYFNTDQEMGNWLTNLTNQGQDALKSEFKNYHKNPGEHFAMGDSAWWIDTIGSLVGSIGSFALSGGIISKSLVGLSRVLKAQKLASAMMGAKNAEIGGQLFNTTSTALMLNQAEGMMEASDVMEATYQFQLQKGLSEEEARAIAIRAGVTTLNTNRINIALNLTSANLFFRAGKYSNSASSIANPSKAASLGRGALEGGQESLEELINMWSGKRGAAIGRGEDYTMANVLEDLNSLEALEAATLGFIGGMGQTVATAEGVNRFMMMGDPENEGQKISIRDYNKRQYAKAKEHVADLNKAFKASDIGTVTEAFKNQTDRLKLIRDIRNAEENDDTAKAEQLKQLLLTVQAEDAFDKGIADHLIKLYEGLGNGPQQEGMGADYKQKAQEAVTMIKDLQKLYDNHVGLEAGKAIYKNRAGRYILNKGIKGAKQELAEAQSALAEEVERLTFGKDTIIDPNFKEIPEDATKEEIALYEKLKKSDAYGKVKDLEGTIVDLNKEIDMLDGQYDVLKSDEIQEAFKKQREANESGEVTEKEEETIEAQSEEIEQEAEKIKEEKQEEIKEKEEEEAIKEVEAQEEVAKEETIEEFDRVINNYSIGEEIPITEKLVSSLDPNEEHGGILIDVDEEAGTMLVEMPDGTVVSINRDKSREIISKPKVHTIPEADFSTEGGEETKIAEPAPDTENTTESGQEGGAKIISRMDDGSPLLNMKGVAWMEEQFGEYLEYERLPMDKRGKRVGFEVNLPYTNNQRRAVNVYNSKIKFKHKDPITAEELRDLYYHLPLLADFGGGVKAPIENETREENRTEGDKSVENFENYTLPLRKNIIDALIAGKDIKKIYSRVQDQYKGVLKVAPKVNGKVAENNVMELDYISGDFSKVDLRVINDDNDLEDKHGETEPGGMAGKGEIYLMIKQANGAPYRLKLNVRRINEAESEVLYQLYKLRLLNQEVNKGTRLSRLPEAEKKIIMDLAAPAIKVMTSTGKSKNDLTVKDLTDFYVWDLSVSEKSRITMDKEGFKFGETVIHGKAIADNKEAFKTWLQENKRHHIKFKSKKNDEVILNAKVENYVKYLLETGIINTNAVVNEPTFQKRTHIYLEPRAMVEGEEQVTPEKKSKEKVAKSPMVKQGMSEAEAIEAVDEMFKAKIMEKKRSLIDSGVKRHLASKQALEFYKDEMAEAKEKMMGLSSEPVPVKPVPSTKIKEPKPVKIGEYTIIGYVKSMTDSTVNPLETEHKGFFTVFETDGKYYVTINKNVSDFARKQILNDPSSNIQQFFEPDSMPDDMSNNITVTELAEVKVENGKVTGLVKKGRVNFKGNDSISSTKLQTTKPKTHNLTPEQQEEVLRAYMSKQGGRNFTMAEQLYLNQVSPKEKMAMADKLEKEKQISTPKVETEETSTIAEGESVTEETPVDPTHPEIAELTFKFKSDLASAEMAYNAGAITLDNLKQEQEELQSKYTEDLKKVSEKIRNIKENIVSLEDIKKQERMDRLAARRAARNNPNKTPPNKNCN